MTESNPYHRTTALTEEDWGVMREKKIQVREEFTCLENIVYLLHSLWWLITVCSLML